MALTFTIPETLLRQQGTLEGVTAYANGIAIMQHGKLLIVKRVEGDFLGGNYEIPGGGVDEGETFLEAVKREVYEETGLKVAAVEGMFEGFDYATDDEPKVRMFCFLAQTTDTATIRLTPQEHDAYAWVTRQDLGVYPMTGEMRACLENFFDSNG